MYRAGKGIVKMKKKVMNVDSLCEIMRRLRGELALLNHLYEIAGATSISEEALGGMCDLLESICNDFQADIDAAEDYKEARA